VVSGIVFFILLVVILKIQQLLAWSIYRFKNLIKKY
jgi:hypothetical protein